MKEEQSAEQPETTLEQYAVGVNNINVDLQRQTSAYGHFREVQATLARIAADPKHVKGTGSLPFVIVRFPQTGTVPGEYRLDLNTVQPQALAAFQPLFDMLSQVSGEALVRAWDNLQQVADATKPIITAAKAAGG